MQRQFRDESHTVTRDRSAGTRVAFTRLVDSVQGLPCQSRERGFTLIEALVVVFIVGLLAAIIVVPINSYWQRSRLETSAGDIRNFLQRAYSEAVNQHTSITASISTASDGRLVMQLNPPPPFPNSHLGTFTLSEIVALDTTRTNWPLASGVRSLQCDPLGRTVDPTSSTQVTQTISLAVTHTQMADGSLTPYVIYNVQLLDRKSVV
jgi:prepilin-type N-terminal cleavage/methylation domain-containing protein